MIVNPTFDMGLVHRLIQDDEIWNTMAEDGISKEVFYPSFDSMSCWLLAKDGDEVIGVVLIHNDNSKSIKIHPYILPEHKGKGKPMAKAFYKWLVENCKGIAKVIITIPFCYKRVYLFAKVAGFIDEGINRMSYCKDGKMYDQWNLGLTIDEIERLL